MFPSEFILPDWPAPPNVHACASTRVGGMSAAPFESFNLATHVGDDAKSVEVNRAKLRTVLRLPAEPLWLEQVHGCAVAEAGSDPEGCAADATVVRGPGAVAAVLTADCLPVLLCDRGGRVAAAAHAGWRGLVGGVIEAALARLGVPPAQVLAWLGPAIGPAAFEVGPEVREQFLQTTAGAEAAFRPSPAGRWLADLYTLARLRLTAQGVRSVSGGHWCTYHDAARFYSYRRDGVTGRMASLIWLE